MNSGDFGRFASTLAGPNRYELLFGTPEKAAHTVVASHMACTNGECGECPFCGFQKCPEAGDARALAEWLREEECEFGINTDATAIRCSKCGYQLPVGTDLEGTRFCGGCGRPVKR